MNILIVDDNKYARKVIEYHIKSLLPQHTPIEIERSSECERMLKQGQAGVIIMDIMMPNINGITLAQQVQSNPNTKDIPIIFFTARTDDAMMKQAHQYSPHVFHKPADTKKMCKKIEELLSVGTSE